MYRGDGFVGLRCYLQQRKVFQFQLSNNDVLSGIQGNDIGDVKFNADGDGLGRYSVYQYQHKGQGGWDYNWIGEFGEKDNFRWDRLDKTGKLWDNANDLTIGWQN